MESGNEMWKKIVSMVLMAVMLLPLMACGEEEPPSAEEITANTIQSMQEVDTYQFEMYTTIEIAVDYNGDTVDEDVSMVIRSIGMADNVNRRLWAEMEATMHTIWTLEEYEEAGMEMYVIGDDSYTLLEEEGQTSAWVKESLLLGSWKDMSEIYSQVAILETGKVERVGSEKLEGTGYYVLEIIPDEEKLAEIVIQNTPQQWMDRSRYLMVFLTWSEEGTEEHYKNVSFKQWVDKEPFYIAKQEVTMER